MAQTTVQSVLQQYSPEQLSELVKYLTPKERAEVEAIVEAEKRNEIVARCREKIASHTRGPMYWLRNWTATENFHWQEQGRQPVAPFPYVPYPKDHWTQERLDVLAEQWPHEFTLQDPPDYLDIVMGFMLNRKRLNVPKSREMMTSWCAVGYITWLCQFYEKTEAIGQSEKEDKAKGLIKYANMLYSHQEEWMKALFPLKRGEEGTALKIEWANGSRFIGVPEGERQVASYHPTLYVNDESAHQPAYMSTLSVVAPVARQIICISSAAPGAFADECGA